MQSHRKKIFRAVESDGSIYIDDMSSLTGWTDDDTAGALTSQVIWRGMQTFKFDVTSPAAGRRAQQTRVLGTSTDVIISYRVYHDSIGTLANTDFFQIMFAVSPTEIFDVLHDTAGIHVYNDVGGWVLFGAGLVLQDTWQEWTFIINESAKTFTTYLDNILVATDEPFDYTVSLAEGELRFYQYGYTNLTTSYLEYTKVGEETKHIHTEIDPKGILLFSDDMSGTFSDNWTDISNGTADVTFTSGEMRLYRDGQGITTGSHVVCNTNFPLSGIVDVYGKVRPIIDADWYDTSGANNGLLLGFIPDDYFRDARSWAYYIPEHWTGGTHEDFVRIRFRNNNNDFYVWTNTTAGGASQLQTYADPGGITRNFQFRVDWENETVEGWLEEAYTGKLALTSNLKSNLLAAASTCKLSMTFYNYKTGTQYCYFDDIEIYQAL